MELEHVKLWHERARPVPEDKDFHIQLGCHLEEIVEMLDCFDFEKEGGVSELRYHLNRLSNTLKNGHSRPGVKDRKGLLDALADQIVTGVGVAHCVGLNISEGVRRVNISNWSKFDSDGQPLRHQNGKIAKGPDYKEPDLEGLY